MIIRLPTHMTPLKPVQLDDILLRPGPRVNYLSHGSGGHTDSIDIETEKDDDRLRDWLKFHSFITNSDKSIAYYQNDVRGHTLDVVREKAQSPRDYDDFLPVIFWRKDSEGYEMPVESYTDLYNRYVTLDRSKKDLVTAYLQALTTHDDSPRRKLFDRSYWRLAQYFSIVDTIAGQPPFCSQSLNCATCKSSGMPHHAVSATKHLKDTLSSLIKNPELTHHYQDIILTVRNEIRHSTVHAAKLPSAKMPPSGKNGDQVYYDTQKSIETHAKDSNALQALGGRLEEATWHLLMNHLFGHGVFEMTRGHSVTYLVLGAGSKAQSR